MLEIGKVVGTHGIKGEFRILSNFEKKDLVFIPGKIIYLGQEQMPLKINSYRHHKDYEMITAEGYDNINQVLSFKGMKVYIKREDLNLRENEYLHNDLIGLDIYDENAKLLGKVRNLDYNNANILLSIEAEKNFYIPLNDNFIVKVELNNKKIIVKNIKGLII